MHRLILILVLMAGQAAADADVFQSPSGNIQCWARFEASSQNIICTIKERGGSAAMANLGRCNDAHSFEMNGRGPVTSFCGVALRGNRSYPSVPYGTTRVTGSFNCRSETTGLSCNNQDGHGFFLSRKTQRVY